MSRRRMVSCCGLSLCDGEAVLLGKQAAVWHSLGGNQAVIAGSQLTVQTTVLPFALAQVEGGVNAVAQQGKAPVLEVDPLGVIAGQQGERQDVALFGLFYIVEAAVAVELDCVCFGLIRAGTPMVRQMAVNKTFLELWEPYPTFSSAFGVVVSEPYSRSSLEEMC